MRIAPRPRIAMPAAAARRLCAALALGAMLCGSAFAEGEPAVDDLPLYKMVRSLEFVQDGVVSGDHSAGEMQRYLLTLIDERLRAATPDLFDDPRNADAAMIYAMSGGNPETLSLIAARDTFGHFDDRLVRALEAYYGGRGRSARSILEPLQKELRDTSLGPYVTLMTANAMAIDEPDKALPLLDWVRLMSPGTILEESALRRAIEIATRRKRIAEGLDYADLYVRRFIHSPYAGQFVDLFVDFVVDNSDQVAEDAVDEVLSRMDNLRQREVLLRIARKAAIAGKNALAANAAGKAEALSTGDDATARTLAQLYSGVASIPSGDVVAAVKAIAEIPDADLSRRDRALREAARIMGEAVIEKPSMAGLSGAGREEPAAPAAVAAPAAQPAPGLVQPPSTAPAIKTIPPAGAAGTPATPSLASAPTPAAPSLPAAAPGSGTAATAAPASGSDVGGGTASAAAAGGQGEIPAPLDGFVAARRSKLAEIDRLLQEDQP